MYKGCDKEYRSVEVSRFGMFTGSYYRFGGKDNEGSAHIIYLYIYIYIWKEQEKILKGEGH